MEDVYIISTARTPVGRRNGYLRQAFAPELLGFVLDDLQRKLPRELRESEGAPAPGDPDWVRGILEQVRPMLVRRLVREGRTS